MIHWHYIVATENGISFSTAVPARTWDAARAAFAKARPFATLVTIER